MIYDTLQKLRYTDNVPGKTVEFGSLKFFQIITMKYQAVNRYLRIAIVHLDIFLYDSCASFDFWDIASFSFTINCASVYLP